MDRRQKKTRQAIFDAFARLLGSRSYSSITVQEIADEADIGRSTFYSHFETKDELLRALCDQVFHHVFSEAGHETAGQEGSSAQGRHLLERKIIHMLKHLHDSRGYLKRVLSCESSEIFMGYFKEYLEAEFDRELVLENAKIPHAYLLNHMVCDFAESVRWWMKHDEYTAEDIGRFFFCTTIHDYDEK